MSVVQCLDVSTAHITELTHYTLGKAAATNKLKITVAKYEYGYFVTVPSEVDPRHSKSLQDIFAYARELGCELVALDSDGVMHPRLKTYDW